MCGGCYARSVYAHSEEKPKKKQKAFFHVSPNALSRSHRLATMQIRQLIGYKAWLCGETVRTKKLKKNPWIKPNSQHI